tara:strand:+ start:3370 stop:3783 length:414 start_codon:yes stop_codon:yes gene_type:complete
MANNNKGNNKKNNKGKKGDSQNMILIGIMMVSIFILFRNCKTKNRFEMMQGHAATPTISMFGREGCGWTTKMREHVNQSTLLSEKVTIEYLDIEVDSAAQQKFQELGLQGVPAFECNGRIASGYMEDYKLLEQLQIP